MRKNRPLKTIILILCGVFIFTSCGGAASRKPDPETEQSGRNAGRAAGEGAAETAGWNAPGNSAPETSEQTGALSAAAPRLLSERFSFTEENFAEKLINPPEAVLADPTGFLALAAVVLEQPEWTLQLVDKCHLLPPDFVPPDLVYLSEYPDIKCGRNNLQLSRPAADSLQELSRAARAARVQLTASSAYRSWQYQQQLFQRYAEKDGEELASRYSARAGASQHQLGTTVDFNSITNAFEESPAGKWMTLHAPEYGWSLSYPRGREEETGYMWESWHWRWTGKAAVQMQKDFFNGSQQAFMEFWADNQGILRGAFE